MSRSIINRQTVGKLLVLVGLMFGFGFAMVPMYRAICEFTGINLLTKADPLLEERVRNTQVDTSRVVTVEFDANNHFGAWQFRPEKRELKVGIRDSGFVQVLEGIKAGERVVTKGAYAIRLSSISGVIPAHGHAH